MYKREEVFTEATVVPVVEPAVVSPVTEVCGMFATLLGGTRCECVSR